MFLRKSEDFFIFFHFKKIFSKGLSMALSKRNKIKADLQSRMAQKNLTTAIYISQLDQYMAWYDQLQLLNKLIKTTDSQRVRFECLKEARQLQKRMQDTLTWLGIDPNLEEAKEEDYDL